ncbi:MAG: phosphoglycerate mutase, partial [Firmicutes bacterium]|nr:phosphoglycerate mutase [Bacillota bacterium]
YCVLMMPDHVTPVATRKHAGDPVPFAFYDSAKSYAGAPYNEQNAAKGMFVDKGHEMIGMFFKRFL